MAVGVPFSTTTALLLHSPSQALCSPHHSRRSTSSFPSPLKALGLRFRPALVVLVGKEETELRVSSADRQQATPQDLEYISKIQRVLDLLKKNRDMTFGEVKLVIMIEDPRDTERKVLLGIEDPDEVTKDDLVTALVDIHEGRIPENRVALRLLAEEMNQWPDLENEAPKKTKRNKSLYARSTDTGVDPKEAAKRLKIDWDSAVDMDSEDESDDIEVPPAVGYSVLFLVTALPLLIGTSVVLILFYNSLQ